MSFRFSLLSPRGAKRLRNSCLLPLACAASLATASGTDPNAISGLKWRNIGPFRGGRISAVTGALGQPGVFYAGLPLGGVWKTTSAGATWAPIFDDVKECSCVGAIEVAPSDPNVIYVGMGDLITGGGINEGNGVYKSTDAGKTWRHMGLDDTRQIPSILVDPHNPNIVMVAAQGNIHEPSESRGVFRTTDGGETWTKTLFVSDETGIQKIAWAYDKPNVMLATSVRHYNAPGAPRPPGGAAPGRNEGPSGTMLFKSTDEGITWKQVKSDTLPLLSGRTCVAVAMNTDAQRMFLVSNSGLYRSDDGGDHWRQMDPTDRRVANGQGGYNCGVYVDPKDPDVIYVINTCSYVSRDGGKSFTGFKGAPGGDDPQQMWIDPTNSSRIFLGMDQGATVSLDAGKTWSSWYNQATAQVYHISVDNSFPYWVYATQQDTGAVATRSRGDLGAITPLDWQPTPGYEFGSIVADPRNPKIVYSGGPGGGIVKITYPNGQWINVSPNIDPSRLLRKVGNQPLIWSRTNPKELFAGFQFLMSTTDGGKSWKKLSPDLGFPKGYKPPVKEEDKDRKGKDAAKKGTVRFYEDEDDDEEEEEGVPHMQGPPSLGGSIESISPSSVDGKVIWVGTSNGLIKVTKDHGATWEDVTIKGLPNATRADISAIDASHQDAGTAYVAIDYHTTGDYKPYLYRTHDFGQTWTKIVNGLATNQPNGSFTRVIRADTVKSGLLFAGTESSMYVSFNDGDDWQSLMLNLPNTSYRDMVVKDNDLVVGTYGRGFWILDDISPLRQITPTMASETARLFKPGDAVRVRRNVNGDTPFPPEVPHALNPPVGEILYYYLGHAPAAEVTLDIRDSAGKLVRHMSSAPIPPSTEPPAPVPDFWLEKPTPLPTAIGTSRINWNLRYDSPSTTNHSYEINANPGETPASPEGPLVLPGIYSVTLTVDGKAYTEKVTVRNDPRSPATAPELRAQNDLQVRLYEGARKAWDGYQKVTALRTAITSIVGSSPPKEVAEAAAALDAKLALVGGSMGGGRRFGGGFPSAGGPPPAPTFAGVDGSLIRQLNSLDSGDMAPNQPTRDVCKAVLADLATVAKNWQALLDKDIPALNALLVKNNLKPLP